MVEKINCILFWPQGQHSTFLAGRCGLFRKIQARQPSCQFWRPWTLSGFGSSSFICPKIQVHTHVCFELVALPVGRFWIWPCRDLVFNRTLLTHKPNWKFIVLLNMMLVRHLGHFIFHKMTWHAAFVANSHFVLIHKGRIMMIVAFQAVNSNKRRFALIDFKRHWQRDHFWNFAHLLS